MWPFRARNIAEEVKRRHIRRLLHSTHLSINLPRILEAGRLQTAGELTSELGNAKAARFIHDRHRYEKFSVGLDFLNCTISNPNYELLYHRSKGDWRAEWVHLVLSVDLLTLESTRFCAVSAAADFGKGVESGFEAFRTLFAESVAEWNREQLEKWEPTHPQAEVLVKGSLALNLVQEIIVPTIEVGTEVDRLATYYGHSMSVSVEPQSFVWPARLAKN